MERILYNCFIQLLSQLCDSNSTWKLELKKCWGNVGMTLDLLILTEWRLRSSIWHPHMNRCAEFQPSSRGWSIQNRLHASYTIVTPLDSHISHGCYILHQSFHMDGTSRVSHISLIKKLGTSLPDLTVVPHFKVGISHPGDPMEKYLLKFTTVLAHGHHSPLCLSHKVDHQNRIVGWKAKYNIYIIQYNTV